MKQVRLLIFVTGMLVSMLLGAISIPLILKKIEPNKVYGVRIDAAYESDEAWYIINYYGGWSLLIAAAVILLLNIILFTAGKRIKPLTYTLLFTAIMLVCLLAASFAGVYLAEQHLNTI